MLILLCIWGLEVRVSLLPSSKALETQQHLTVTRVCCAHGMLLQSAAACFPHQHPNRSWGLKFVIGKAAFWTGGGCNK